MSAGATYFVVCTNTTNKSIQLCKHRYQIKLERVKNKIIKFQTHGNIYEYLLRTTLFPK